MNAFFDPTVLSHLVQIGAGGVASKLEINHTFWLQTFFFIVCWYILSQYLFPPVKDVLLKRQKMIEQAYQELKRYEMEGQELEQSYHDKIHEARVDAQRIHKESRNEASSQERSIIEEARTEATKTLNQREVQAKQQRDALRETLTADAEKLGSEIAGKILGRSL